MLMGTYHLHPNDTIILGDTVAVNLAQKPDGCHACVVTSATNSADVKIVKSITNSLWIIVAIIVGGYVLTKWMSHIYDSRADIRKRKAEVEDEKRKMRAEFLSKELPYIKEFYYETKEDSRVKTVDGKTTTEKVKVRQIKQDPKLVDKYTEKLKEIVDKSLTI